jgi:hypothetical protein
MPSESLPAVPISGQPAGLQPGGPISLPNPKPLQTPELMKQRIKDQADGVDYPLQNQHPYSSLKDQPWDLERVQNLLQGGGH